MQQCNCCCCVRCVESQMHTMPVCGPGRCVHERRRDKNSIQIHQPVSHVQKELLQLQPAVHFMTYRGWWCWRCRVADPGGVGAFFHFSRFSFVGGTRIGTKKENATKLQGTNLKIPFLIRSHQSRRAK